MINRELSILGLAATVVLLIIVYGLMVANRQFLLPSLFSIVAVLVPVILFVFSLKYFVTVFNIGIQFKNATVIGLLICLAPCIYFGCTMLENYPKALFNEVQWKSRPKERVLVIDDLLNNGKLHGLTRDQVRNLLGEPLNTDHFSLVAPNGFVYYLGPYSYIFPAESQYLLINFDNNQKVAKCEVVTD
ncbi:MAG: hypothetical protein ACM3PP_10140 [Candidatus Saccharibacteria bacterium]